MQSVFHKLQRRNHLSGICFNGLQRTDLLLSQNNLFRFGRKIHNQIVHAVDVFSDAQLRSGRYSKGYNHSGNGSVYPTLHETIPDSDTQHQVKRTGRHPHLVTNQQDTQYQQRIHQVVHVAMGTVEKGNDQNTSDIIHYGKGSQENLQTQGDPLTEKAQHSQRKSDIRSHRNRQSVYRRCIAGNQVIDNHRHNHSATGSDDG